jgi:hypothetical protein
VEQVRPCYYFGVIPYFCTLLTKNLGTILEVIFVWFLTKNTPMLHIIYSEKIMDLRKSWWIKLRTIRKAPKELYPSFFLLLLLHTFLEIWVLMKSIIRNKTRESSWFYIYDTVMWENVSLERNNFMKHKLGQQTWHIDTNNVQNIGPATWICVYYIINYYII